MICTPYFILSDKKIIASEIIRAIIHKTISSKTVDAVSFIMSWILCWRMNKASCNLNNLNSGNFFRISQGLFELKDEYRVDGAIESVIHSSCGVQYITPLFIQVGEPSLIPLLGNTAVV